jgi:hypothetical protein
MYTKSLEEKNQQGQKKHTLDDQPLLLATD